MFACKGRVRGPAVVALALLIIAASTVFVMFPQGAWSAGAVDEPMREFLARPESVKGDGAHYLGWQLSPPGDYRPAPAAPSLWSTMALSTAADLTSQLPPVGNQGSQGSCVGWATSYYYKTWSEKQDHSSWNLADSRYQFSPSFVYNQINGGADNGADFQDAFSLLQAKGDVDIAEMPYNQSDWTAQPTYAQLEASRPYRIPSGWSYFWLRYTNGPFNPSNSIDNAKAWLDSGKMLVMGIPVYYDFPAFAGNPARAYYDYNGTSGLAGGHAVCICGYDDNAYPSGADADHRGGFKMVNSWGSGWNGASAGFVYLSYDFVKRYVWEAWMMGDNDPDSPGISHLSTGSGQVGQTVEINGVNFGSRRRSAGVSFNGTEAVLATFTNEKVTTVVPSGATTGPLVVRDWEGTASNPVTFTVGGGVVSPSVSSVSPAGGANDGAHAISVEGAGFAPGCQVRLAGGGAPPIEAAGENVVSGGRVDCTVDLSGAQPGERDAIVENPDGGYGTLPGGFEITSSGNDTFEPNDSIEEAYGPLAPSTTCASYIWSEGDSDWYKLNVPAGCMQLCAALESIPAGCDYDLYLYGTEGGQLASSRNASNLNESIVFNSPGAGTCYLLVESWEGSSQVDPYALAFTLALEPPAPGIDSITPTGGPRQTPVTINGHGFGAGRGTSSVRFGAVGAASGDYVSWSDERIVVRVPGGVGGRPLVRVRTGAGTSNGFYFKVTPQVSTINPIRGRAGTLVTVYGQGFGPWSSGYTCVYFGSQRAISYGGWTNNRITVRVPKKVKGKVQLKVKTAGGTSAGKPFTVY